MGTEYGTREKYYKTICTVLFFILFLLEPIE